MGEKSRHNAPPGCTAREKAVSRRQGGEERSREETHTSTQTDLRGVCVEWAREGRQTDEAEADRWGRRVSEQDGEGPRGRDRQTASQTGE